MISEWSRESREVPADWKPANVLPIFKKGKEDSGNSRSISLTSVPGKIMEKIILGSIKKQLEDNAVIGHSQHSFVSAYVPKTEAGHCKWAEVLKDLEKIKTSKDIDVSLYTADTDEDEECQELVMRCFFLETEVIIQECRIKNCSETQDVVNIWKNGNAGLGNSKLNSTTSAKCKECEEYEEKSFTEFIQSFVKMILADSEKCFINTTKFRQNLLTLPAFPVSRHCLPVATGINTKLNPTSILNLMKSPWGPKSTFNQTAYVKVSSEFSLAASSGP
ncbi:hypothetical protein WISP_41836 [Willisornis vidua]|uniref:Interleukin n=1 Tax=Willisornis vidua TaxID=1566151 RepID=A0ABQ9DGJ4_9PASS|nr:hypothetical protein WISP_41836 [Willisornis vidua]